jgi:hypothetical protein
MTTDETLPAVRKPLGDTSIEELTGVKANGGDVVLVNLNRAAMVIDCGSMDDFVNSVQMCNGIKAAVWNEKGITIALSDRYTIVKYEPPIHENARIFFETKRLSDRRWTGSYEPVQFAKKDLIRFLKESNIVGGTKEVIDAVQNLKLRESYSESTMISLEEDESSSTVEESFKTNVPKKFSVNMPVTPDFTGEFKFEVQVDKPSDKNASPSQRKISLLCTNPLEVQRAAVEHVLCRLPKEIPRIYGEMKITTREHW